MKTQYGIMRFPYILIHIFHNKAVTRYRQPFSIVFTPVCDNCFIVFRQNNTPTIRRNSKIIIFFSILLNFSIKILIQAILVSFLITEKVTSQKFGISSILRILIAGVRWKFDYIKNTWHLRLGILSYSGWLYKLSHAILYQKGWSKVICLRKPITQKQLQQIILLMYYIKEILNFDIKTLMPV